jgi:hypothetical protein
MKKLVIVVSLLLACVVYAQLQPVIQYDTSAQRVDPGQLHTTKRAWVTLDSTSSAGTEPTDLAVTERTYATVVAAIATAANGDDEISIYGDDDGERREISSWNGVRFRCIGTTNDGTATYEVDAGTLTIGGTDCNLAYMGQLAFTIGTQTSTTATYELADTLTAPSASDWTSSWTSVTPTGNRVAEAKIDLQGADLLVLVPTTASADCQLLGKGF